MKRSPRTIKSDAALKIDIRDVAAHAGVSIATVSRAINRVPTVDPVLAERVWSAVAELNYFPNTQARALVSGKSKLLGLIVSEITNPFFPELIQEFEQLAVEHGYEILAASTNHETKKIEQCARRMLERKVDGVAVMTFDIQDLLFERLAADKIPIVFIDASPARPFSSFLAVDHRAGIFEGVQHLAVLGHRKIGFISGPLQLLSAELRKTAFLDCLRSVGLKAENSWIIEGDHTLVGGRNAMQKILAQPDRPTAIMCSNDMTAIGVQHALFEANLKVPEDFSLIGFDDIHIAAVTIPPLTTIQMSRFELARAAVTALRAHVEEAADFAQNREFGIQTNLIVRESTGFPRGTMADLQISKDKPKATR